MPHRPKHVVEYLALRAVSLFVNLLPYRGALAVGWAVAFLSHFVFRFRAAAAMRRIRQVFGPGMRAREVRRTAWRSWLGIVFTAVETLRLPRVTPEYTASVCDCADFLETLRRHAGGGAGAVLACPHMGAWELAAAVCRQAGLPIFSIAAPQKNPLANAYLDRLRRSPGAESIARGSGTLRQVVRRIREGGVLAILPDVRSASPGLSVPFLGGRANVARGMAAFAHAAGVPIFPCCAERAAWTRHRIRVWDPIRPDAAADRGADVRRMTEEVFAVIDRAVRDRPEQWFWYNKRWILDPL